MSEVESTKPGRAVILLALALILVLGSNLVDILRANAAMTAGRDRIERATAASKGAEAQLNALALGTATLANSGNPNAQAVIATLKQNGVAIKDPPK